MKKESKKTELEKLAHQLKQDRLSFESHWRELSDFMAPRRSRWFASDTNKGDARNNKIVDSTAVYAIRVATSGLMSGVTSPSRPWFDLQVEGVSAREPGPVNTWLYNLTVQMRDALRRSNFYQAMPTFYRDLVTFGTSCLYNEDDADIGTRFEVLPIGSYAAGRSGSGRLDVISREFQMSVRELVNEFGYENVSEGAQKMYDSGNTEEKIQVRHIARPNEKYDPDSALAFKKRYSSDYYEIGMQHTNATITGITPKPAGEDEFLRESGYDDFPFYIARWEVMAGDTYATDCPGMTSLGDVKELQLCRRRVMQAIDKKINPPLIAPTSFRNAPISILPGKTTYANTREGQQGIRAVHEVNFEVRELQQEMELTRERIDRAFFVDLFLLLARTDRREMTATEAELKQEEKLWVLGPVMEGLNQDLLNPLIDHQFNKLFRDGKVEPPPQELAGKEIKIEYVSAMARALKAVDIGSVDRFTNFAANMSQFDPSVLDKMDMDQLIDMYAEMTGVPAGLVRSDDDTAEIRQRRQQQQAQQQRLEQLEQSAKIAKDASAADMGGNNALTQALGGS